MTDDSAPKSAYELAMERLRKKDAEAGLEWQPLTDEQKAAVAEIRSFYDAKLAELDVMHQSKMRASMDSNARTMLEEDFRRERMRLTTERDAKIEKARRFLNWSPAVDLDAGLRLTIDYFKSLIDAGRL